MTEQKVLETWRCLAQQIQEQVKKLDSEVKCVVFMDTFSAVLGQF